MSNRTVSCRACGKNLGPASSDGPVWGWCDDHEPRCGECGDRIRLDPEPAAGSREADGYCCLGCETIALLRDFASLPSWSRRPLSDDEQTLLARVQATLARVND